MAGGAGVMGLVYFAAIKFAGYSLAARYLRTKYPHATPNSWVVGGTRTVLGVVAGVGAVALAEIAGIGVPSVGWYALLAPVRLLEWLVVIWFFYERASLHATGGIQWRRALGWSALGILWSGLLDIPAVLAVIALPGGVWVC